MAVLTNLFLINLKTYFAFVFARFSLCEFWREIIVYQWVSEIQIKTKTVESFKEKNSKNSKT